MVTSRFTLINSPIWYMIYITYICMYVGKQKYLLIDTVVFSRYYVRGHWLVLHKQIHTHCTVHIWILESLVKWWWWWWWSGSCTVAWFPSCIMGVTMTSDSFIQFRFITRSTKMPLILNLAGKFLLSLKQMPGIKWTFEKREGPC